MGGGTRSLRTRNTRLRRAVGGVRRRAGRGIRRWGRPHRYAGKAGALVKSVLMRNAETKFVRDDNISASTGFNSVIAAQTDYYRCFPQVTQGTQSHQRIGQRITPVSITCRVNGHFDRNDALSRDIEVHVFFLNVKQQKSVLAAYSIVPGLYNITNKFLLHNYGELLDNGDGTNTSFGGDFLATTKPVNKDAFTLIKRYKIHLYKGAGTSNNDQVANNEKRQFTINCRLPVHQFIYDAQTDALPQNYMPVMCIGYRYLDGNPADTTGGVIQVQASSSMYFKDL